MAMDIKWDEMSCQPGKDYSMGRKLERIRKLKILTESPNSSR